MRKQPWWIIVLIGSIALPSLSGCRQGQGDGAVASADGAPQATPRIAVPSGTHMRVRLTTTVSSETARIGDAWSGVIVDPVRAGGREVLAAGTEVRGTVTGALEAKRGSRAMLDIVVEEITVDGRTVPLQNANLRGDAIEFTISPAAGKPMMFRGRVTGNTMEPRAEGGAVTGWSAVRTVPAPPSQAVIRSRG